MRLLLKDCLDTFVWADDTVGTGYTEGPVTGRDEYDVSEQIVGFMQQWLAVFPEMKGKNFFREPSLVCMLV